VRLLLDQNLSPKLIRRLADLLPGLESVYDHGLIGASDPVIFDWARKMEFAALVSTDLDFVDLAQRIGPPPKNNPDRTMRLSIEDHRAAYSPRMIRIHNFLDSERGVLLLKL
jgi:predicted nuclease of predicted toxin-antitoxin system